MVCKARQKIANNQTVPHLALSEMRLACPKHKWVFDVSTGECVEKGSRSLRQFDSRVAEDRLQAIW